MKSSLKSQKCAGDRGTSGKTSENTPNELRVTFTADPIESKIYWLKRELKWLESSIAFYEEENRWYEKQFKMCNPSVPLNIQINGSYIENFSLVQYAQGNGKEEAGL